MKNVIINRAFVLIMVLTFLSLSFRSLLLSQDTIPPGKPTGLIVRAAGGGGGGTGTCLDTIAGVWPQTNYPNDPAYTISPPKAFMYVVKTTGYINCFNVYINGLQGDRSHDPTIVAVYENRMVGNTPWPGPLKCYQQINSYNWTSQGVPSWHVFDNLVEAQPNGKYCVAGDSIWVLLWTAPGAGEVIGVCRSDDSYFFTCRAAINNDNTPATPSGIAYTNYSIHFSCQASGYGYIVIGEAE